MRAYERLIEYTKYATASSEATETTPSTPNQLIFARALVEEMKGLGIADASVDENGYVMGTVPANIEGWDGKVIGLIAHMDVAQDVPSENITCVLHENYDGGRLVINEAEKIVLDPADYPYLTSYKGKTLLTTDGTTLLGADDKAGIAEILTLAERLNSDPSIKHGRIKIGFTPDEEIGQGADHFDVERFGADFAFTLDGAGLGEVEYETFNATGAKVIFNGFNIHPGEAKDRMVNSALIAFEFDSMLPALERPEHTEGYEGFYHLLGIKGEVERSEMNYIIRDHDRKKLEDRKALFEANAAKLREKYGPDSVVLEMRDSYYNMAEIVEQHPELLELARAAVRECGIEPVTRPVRGGTDGSRLSFMGLPCPNLGTGSHNHHGRSEFAVVEDMDTVVDILADLVQRF
ncbi:MAG: peptidase T [Clostridia bacterium]|nr:peptidase T [Clostridia bacterium]